MEKFSPHIIRGCLIVLGGVCYRIVSVHRRCPDSFPSTGVVYDGRLCCLHPEPQTAQVRRKGHRYYLFLRHTWLQHSHKGVIVAYAELCRYGRIPGPDRWLRVPRNFPLVPSAALANRVAVPWRRRKPMLGIVPYVRPAGPLEPLATEEILFDQEVRR